MKFRGPLIALTVFMAVALALTWLVYATLRRDVAGGTTSYSAIFTDVYGLRDGDDVRMAGVRVGRVEKIELVNNKQAKVDFVVQNDQKLYGNTLASVTYQNIVGQRYLGLSLGKTGDTNVLAGGSTIPVERTDPSFDVTTLLNGYEPLFSTLSPEQADNLTKGVIQSLQPEGPGSLPNKTIDLAHTEVPYDLQATLRDATNTFDQVDFDKVAQSLSILGKQLDGLPEVVPQAMQNIQTLSQIIAERRDQLGTLLKSSEKVTNTLRHQQQGIGTLINQGQNLIGEFVVRRGTFHAMMQSLTNLVQQLSKITIKDRPQLDEMLRTLHQLTDMLGQHDDLLRNILQITPVTLRGVANATGTGNAIEFNAPNGLAVDSWMCAISGRAKQFGMIQYFKDCK